MSWTMQFRYVRCGKAHCGNCAEVLGGIGHGPYWYGYERVDGRVRSKYFGRHYPSADVVAAGFVGISKPANATRGPRVSERADPRFQFGKRMDWATALRIMGFVARPSTRTLHNRYRELLLVHHPDHGGSTQVATAINLAYAYLKS